ncbi:sensor histidine kinase [Bdellovibrio sp. HCB2-146]|uniref:sensor histidine kinase n=1 Tax=Bdellovibrio sp. HCB2-146 TaxID=3394362 RepID=UPI0039BCC456
MRMRNCFDTDFEVSYFPDMASKTNLVGTISLFIISLFLLVALLGLFIISVFSNSVSDSLKKVYLSQAQSIGEQIGSQFFERNSDIRAISGALKEIPSMNTAAGVRLLNSYAHLYRLYDLILFVDQNGKPVFHNTTDLTGAKIPALIQVSPEEIRRTAWFTQTIGTDLAEKSPRGSTGVFFDVVNKGPILKLIPNTQNGYSIFATAATFGNLKGVLVTYARLDWIRVAVELQYAKFVDLGLGDSVIRVVKGDGSELTRLGDPTLDFKKNESKNGFSIEAPLQSNQVPDSLGWKVQIFTPNSEVKSLVQYWRNYFIVIAFAFLGLAILVTVYFGRQFTSLSQQYDRAVAIRDELEVRVRERTQDLEDNLNEIKVMQKRMIAQEKMAGLGVLSTGLAHEIKNPLSILSSSASILRGYLNGKMKINQHEADELCSVILKHADRIDMLVKSILISAKKNVGPRSDINLVELVEEMMMLSLKAFRVKNNIDIPHLFEVSGEDCHVVMHTEECRRIVANLLDNAIFSLLKKWGYNEIDKALLKVRIKRDGDVVSLTVEDNGVGIPENIQKNIFTPFFTTKEPGQGTGLGLSMSIDLAKKYDGRLYFESVENEFCKFTLEIPHGKA